MRIGLKKNQNKLHIIVNKTKLITFTKLNRNVERKSPLPKHCVDIDYFLNNFVNLTSTYSYLNLKEEMRASTMIFMFTILYLIVKQRNQKDITYHVQQHHL